MDGYRQFWNVLIYGNEGLGPQSLERYWASLIVFALICTAIGLASRRYPLAAPIATAAIAAAYVISLVPFMYWSAGCGGCGASYSYDAARSGEVLFLHLYWGGLLMTGIAAIWIGVLLSRGADAMIDWRRSRGAAPPTSQEP